MLNNGGLKLSEGELSPRQSQTFGTLYSSAWSKLHVLTLSTPDLKRTDSTKHFDRLYVLFHGQSMMNIKAFLSIVPVPAYEINAILIRCYHYDILGK